MSIRESDDKALGRWQAISSESLIWASWDGDYIAYHRSSGKTHFLNRSSYLLIAELLREPQPTEIVVDAFLGDSADRAATGREILALLEHLEERGLVDRRGPMP